LGFRYKEKVSFSKVELFEKSSIDASSGHQQNCVGSVRGNPYRYLRPERHSVCLVLIKIVVEGYDLNFSFDAANRSIDPDVSIESLVVDVFNHYADILLHHAVAASVHTDLLKFALTLGEILTAFLNNLVFVVVLATMEGNWDCGKGDD
jgi:hypothetical protein